MNDSQQQERKKEAAEALEEMQNFDVARLPREDELGKSLSFKDAIPPAERLIELYKRLAPTVMDDLPMQQLDQIKNQAIHDRAQLGAILDFDSKQTEPHAVRDGLVQALSSTYQKTFNSLYPLISYSLQKSADFQQLGADARETFKEIKEAADLLQKELEKHETEARRILSEIRQAAAEQGVTQQAIHFGSEADNHEEQAKNWLYAIICFSILLVLYAVGSLFIHKIPFLATTDGYEVGQLIVSKILIFAVISYMLYLSASNYLTRKHNAVINRHRQNALMTYQALVDAAGEHSAGEAVLIHAAACIFSPQETGFRGRGASQMQNAQSVIELLSKPITDGG